MRFKKSTGPDRGLHTPRSVGGPGLRGARKGPGAYQSRARCAWGKKRGKKEKRRKEREKEKGKKEKEKKGENKAVYTAASVACGWAGAVW